MIDELLKKLKDGAELTGTEIESAAESLLDEQAGVDERVAFLGALADKGETPEEIAGFVKAFLKHAVSPTIGSGDLDKPMIDVCGTGGDKLDLFNVSTTSMFVLAAGGVAVAKHGNRGITSKSGGADVLEALGVRIDLPPEQFAECLKKHGAAFMLAPQYHPAFKAIVPVRGILAEQGKRTIFNLIGPLLNPVQPDFQLIGVFGEELPPVYAKILAQLGRKCAWAVHGKTDDARGMDEVSTLGKTLISKTSDGTFEDVALDPTEFGASGGATVADLQGGDAEENGAILENILSGVDRGPKREIVLANAAAGFVVAGVADSLADGVTRGADAIDSGAAAGVLEALKAFGK